MLVIRQRHVFKNRQFVAGTFFRILKHAADLICTFVFRQTGNIFPPKKHLAALHRQGAADDIEKRCLTRAIGADDGDELPFLHLKTELVKQRCFIRRANVEFFCDLVKL